MPQSELKVRIVLNEKDSDSTLSADISQSSDAPLSLMKRWELLCRQYLSRRPWHVVLMLALCTSLLFLFSYYLSVKPLTLSDTQLSEVESEEGFEARELEETRQEVRLQKTDYQLGSDEQKPARAARSGFISESHAGLREPKKPDVTVYTAGISRATLAKSVRQLEPESIELTLDKSLNLPTHEPQRVYLFAEMVDMAGDTITHLWRYQGKVVARVPIRVAGNRWRSYSSKYLPTSQQGLWQVSIIDPKKEVLAESTFWWGERK